MWVLAACTIVKRLWILAIYNTKYCSLGTLKYANTNTQDISCTLTLPHKETLRRRCRGIFPNSQRWIGQDLGALFLWIINKLTSTVERKQFSVREYKCSGGGRGVIGGTLCANNGRCLLVRTHTWATLRWEIDTTTRRVPNYDTHAALENNDMKENVSRRVGCAVYWILDALAQ